MESRKIVYRETGIVALGVAACAGVMVLVFALGGWYSLWCTSRCSAQHRKLLFYGDGHLPGC